MHFNSIYDCIFYIKKSAAIMLKIHFVILINKRVCIILAQSLSTAEVDHYYLFLHDFNSRRGPALFSLHPTGVLHLCTPMLSAPPHNIPSLLLLSFLLLKCTTMVLQFPCHNIHLFQLCTSFFLLYVGTTPPTSSCTPTLSLLRYLLNSCA